MSLPMQVREILLRDMAVIHPEESMVGHQGVVNIAASGGGGGGVGGSGGGSSMVGPDGRGVQHASGGLGGQPPEEMSSERGQGSEGGATDSSWAMECSQQQQQQPAASGVSQMVVGSSGKVAGAAAGALTSPRETLPHATAAVYAAHTLRRGVKGVPAPSAAMLPAAGAGGQAMSPAGDTPMLHSSCGGAM
jgi:hypothetical protein